MPPRTHKVGVTAEQVLQEAFASSKSASVAHPEGENDGSGHPEGEDDGSEAGDKKDTDLQVSNPKDISPLDFDSATDSDDDNKVSD